MGKTTTSVSNSRCRRCNRLLKTQPYAALGIGRICAQKEAWEKERHAAGADGSGFVGYDGGDIFIERLAPRKDRRGFIDSIMKPMAPDSASGIVTNIPRRETAHSPDGFNFGYAGSGPADFALNICLLFCNREEDARRIHQMFKIEFTTRKGVLTDTGERLTIPRNEVVQWLQNRGIKTRFGLKPQPMDLHTD